MNIDKYIKNTEEKTKKAKLPALSTLTPIMPDGAAGISTFNSSFGSAMSEDLSTSDIEEIQQAIVAETNNFLLEKGFDKEDLERIADFDFDLTDYLLKIVIKIDITISSLRELADTLYPIISAYDEDAYFDISANRGISVEIDMKKFNISEALHKLDSKGMEKYDTNYDFEALYESANGRLTASDRAKLTKFLQSTDDPEEVNTYMKGLLLEEDADDRQQLAIDDTLISEILSLYNELNTKVNQLTIEANKVGNDVLRRSADLASGALDDLNSYLQEMVESSAPTEQINIFEYVKAFVENYKDEQEFEDATDLEYTLENIADVIYDWMLGDYQDESVAETAAFEAAQQVLEG